MQGLDLGGRPKRRWWRRTKRPRDMEAVFLEHRDLIERVAISRAHRAGFPPQDVEDFLSAVTVKLIDNDYAVLRKHRGESRMSTYLTTVVLNQFKDFCNHKLGRYRPSAKAKDLGTTAKALEQLLVRDQHDLESAIEILTRQGIEESPEELRELAARLPPKYRRQLVGDEALATFASTAPESYAEHRLAEGERSKTAARVEKALNAALAALSTQDKLLLKMHFRDGCTIATIAKALRVRQRPLYSQKEKCFKQLYQAFAAEGLTWTEVQEILGWSGQEIQVDFEP